MEFVLGRKLEYEIIYFFHIKWLWPAMKGISCARRVRLRSICFFYRIVMAVSNWFGDICRYLIIGILESLIINYIRIIRLFFLFDIAIWSYYIVKWIAMVVCTLHGAYIGKDIGIWNESGYFPYKMASIGDKNYLLRAVEVAAVGLPFFFHAVTVASSCFGCACACVIIGSFGICGCKSHWNGFMIVVMFCCHGYRDIG